MKKVVLPIFIICLLVLLVGCKKDVTPEVVPDAVPVVAPIVTSDSSVEVSVNVVSEVVPNADLEINTRAKAYCDNGYEVYICGTSIKVVSMALGAGYTYYKTDGISFGCPVVAPDSMSEECKALPDDDCEEVCKGAIQ